MDNSTPESPEHQPVPPALPPPLGPRVESPPLPPIPPGQFWKGFLDLTGGSLLYCLSALSIIYGITQIMGPLLLKTGVLSETLPCIGALNLYEVALLGTLAFIVVGRQVTDDAISLVVLIPLFLVGSGIALDTVANTGPVLALGIGALCAAAGGVKLAVLRQAIRVPFGWLALGGLALVVTWNFLAGPALVNLFATHPELMADKRFFWLSSLLLLLISGTLVLVETIRNPARSSCTDSPFLRTCSMVSVFALVLLGAAGAHLYALGYQFDVRFADGDFLLLATLGVALLLEAMLRFGERLHGPAAVVGCAPLVGTVIVLLEKGFTVPVAGGLEWMGHPSTILVAGGLGMVRMALRTRWTACWWIVGSYGLAVVLTAGFSPSLPADLNWRLFAGLLVAGLFAVGVALKRPGLCVVAVAVGTVGLPMTSGFQHAVEAVGLIVPGGMAGVGGLALLVVALAFKDKTLIPVAIIGALGVTGSAFDFVSAAIGWRDLVMLCVLAFAGGLVWWRLRSLVAVIILGVPVVVRLWLLFRTLSAWRYVVLSFVLLAGGAWLSNVKSRRTRPVAASDDSKTKSCGFLPGVDPLKLNELSDEIETDEFIARHRTQPTSTT